MLRKVEIKLTQKEKGLSWPRNRNRGLKVLWIQVRKTRVYSAGPELGGEMNQTGRPRKPGLADWLPGRGFLPKPKTLLLCRVGSGES